MDDYKKLFYMNRPDLLNSEIASVTKRLQFREDRQCKSFNWYLQNIYPQKFLLDNPSHVFAYGRLRNPNYDTCLDNLQNEDKDPYELGQYVCHNFMAAAQFFSYSKEFEIRREDFCAQVTAVFPQTRERITMAQCKKGDGSQQWAHTKEGKIIHKYTRKCLDGGSGQSMETLSVAPCQNIPSQVWYFDHYFK
jgi:polypeptide N-acetylgalactosaminyltransferase